MHLPIGRFGAITDLASGDSWAADHVASEAARRGAALAAAGVGRGDAVLVFHGGTPAFFADLFAVWSVGGIAACLNPGLTPEELARVAAFVSAKAVCVGAGAPEPRGIDLPVMRGDLAPPADAPALLPGNVLDDPALMLFTSGTTGTPKGVVHTFRSILARLSLNAAHIGPAAMRHTLCTLPTHFGHGLIGNCLSALHAGGDVFLMPGGSMKAVAGLGETIDAHRIGFMSSVPSFWKMALKLSPPPKGGTLRRVHVGSAPLAADLWKRVITWSGGADVVNMYGITETANWLGGAPSSEFEPRDGLIGRMWGGQVAVLDASGRIAPTGEGELVVQSPSLMAGYFGREDLSRASLVSGWFRTGDIGTVGADGVAVLTGRQKYEINRAGMKVHPEDIDLLLERHESVREACAFGLPDEVAGETVGVAVSPHDRSSFDLPALKAWCAARLAREKVPERWFVVDEIPKTDRGKINRDNVAKACLAQGRG
jgi:acyl-CoA synthetase (AMP-forming)/AMP-acid ligase II